jgi:hypothetical protein
MSKNCLLAVATFLCATGMVLTAQSAAVEQDCTSGELTISRLADGACTARIPLPTARPGDPKAVKAAPVREWEFIEAPGAAPGQTRMVRLVGSRFLPDQREMLDFRAHSTAKAGLLSAAFNRTIAYLGFSTPDPENQQEEGGVQEASIDFDPAVLRN